MRLRGEGLVTAHEFRRSPVVTFADYIFHYAVDENFDGYIFTVRLAVEPSCENFNNFVIGGSSSLRFASEHQKGLQLLSLLTGLPNVHRFIVLELIESCRLNLIASVLIQSSDI